MSPGELISARAWLNRLDQSRHALWLLFSASMLETLIVPIPIEVILMPWMLCHPHRKWQIASVALAGNLTAAALGYYTGVLAMDAWGDSLINFFGTEDAYREFEQRMAQDGFTAIMAIGLVPVPFQLAMLAAGASGYPFTLFMLAAILARGLRYFGLAMLVAVAGEQALQLWQRHSRLLGTVAVTLLILWLWLQLKT